jgi:hypothetical protein
MAKLAWFKFYPGDWLRDPDLRRCSPAARALWIDLLCLMFECEERGVLISSGRPWTHEEIAAAVTGDTSANLTVLRELLDKGVARIDKRNAIFSARMVRDWSKSQKCSEAGKRGGGNPTFKGRAKGVSKGTPKGTSDFYSLNSKERGCGGKPPDLPDVLNNDVFLEAWADWVRHRSEIRKPLKPTTIKKQLKKLAAMGVVRAVAAIEHSIANGYQGLFEPKTPPGVPKPPEPPPIHIPDELIPPWDKDHAAGGPLCSTKDRWWQYGDDYKAGRMNGPDWWRDTPMGRKWLREQQGRAQQ